MGFRCIYLTYTTLQTFLSCISHFPKLYLYVMTHLFDVWLWVWQYVRTVLNVKSYKSSKNYRFKIRDGQWIKWWGNEHSSVIYTKKIAKRSWYIHRKSYLSRLYMYYQYDIKLLQKNMNRVIEKYCKYRFPS